MPVGLIGVASICKSAISPEPSYAAVICVEAISAAALWKVLISA